MLLLRHLLLFLFFCQYYYVIITCKSKWDIRNHMEVEEEMDICHYISY